MKIEIATINDVPELLNLQYNAFRTFETKYFENGVSWISMEKTD